MPEKQKWIDKVLDVFIGELNGTDQHPKDDGEKKLQQKILTLIQFRSNGLDWRKMGLLAADLYRLMYKTRVRIIEDLAQVAVKEAEKQEGSES